MSVKGAQQFLDNNKQTYPHKIPARPRGGRPLTGCAWLSLFFGCAERYGSTEKVPLPLGFCIGSVWVLSGNSTSAVPVNPCRKCV